MNDCVHDEKGVIYVGVIFISLIIFVLSTSLLNILLNNNMIISSNNDNYRAGYIVESILELKIEEIMKLCSQATVIIWLICRHIIWVYRNCRFADI